MRRVYYSDVSGAARVLLKVPRESRSALCAQMFAEAETADRFLRKLGKLHPVYGNGTLRGAAFRHVPEPEPSFDNPDYRACFMEVLQRLEQKACEVV
ncbi:hypothetical protein Z945_1736 [Sulfitobacter noctilucae]|uniref:DUF7742 family protein n=1 Tax=Sulfitobacter noctilucae TaxID=1342302 RepID=UPI00046847CC|nr:hypothetical protein [Sulfitobacter noctilucae]KIN60757.1 hypothetical protein Z945_1736 [Sulfitobacter noctilucae]